MLLDPDALTTLRKSAATLRASWLHALSNQMVTLDELIGFAATKEGKPLLAVKLTDLLSAQPGWSVRRANQTVRRLCMVLGVDDDAGVLGRNLSWLMDARTDRSVAWRQVVGDHATPWPGFPWHGAGPDDLVGHDAW